MKDMRLRRNAWMTAAALAVGACAAPGPAADPIARKLTWFSYLNGDDLRAACTSDSPNRYRMVFNADYNEHVRTYDVVGDREGVHARIEARVIKAPDLARVDLADPVAAWAGDVAEGPLSPRQYALLVVKLYESGAFKVEPGTLRLPSNGFYWLVSGCHNGQWFFSAYPYPSDRFADVRFDRPLREADPTGVPFPTLPAPTDAPRSPPPAGLQDEGGVFFTVEVAGDGLVGPTRTFGRWPFAEPFSRWFR